MIEQPAAEKRTYAFPLALLGVGALVGVAFGVLFAPDKGSETRRKMKDWMKEKSQKGREDLHRRTEQLTAAVIAGRKAYEEASDRKKEPSIR